MIGVGKKIKKSQKSKLVVIIMWKDGRQPQLILNEIQHLFLKIDDNLIF